MKNREKYRVVEQCSIIPLSPNFNSSCLINVDLVFRIIAAGDVKNTVLSSALRMHLKLFSNCPYSQRKRNTNHKVEPAKSLMLTTGQFLEQFEPHSMNNT